MQKLTYAIGVWLYFIRLKHEVVPLKTMAHKYASLE